jgi:hypothetical protein
MNPAMMLPLVVLLSRRRGTASALVVDGDGEAKSEKQPGKGRVLKFQTSAPGTLESIFMQRAVEAALEKAGIDLDAIAEDLASKAEVIEHVKKLVEGYRDKATNGVEHQDLQKQLAAFQQQVLQRFATLESKLPASDKGDQPLSKRQQQTEQKS